MKQLKEGQLTRKDMSVLKEDVGAKTQVHRNWGVLRDHSLRHSVKMRWGLDDADRDLRPFYLIIDKKRFLLSWGELKDVEYTEFFRRENDAPVYCKLSIFDGPHIQLDTDLNDEAEQDMMFRLKAGNMTVILDWYQFLRLGRFI
jgi:hypothetical protein